MQKRPEPQIWEGNLLEVASQQGLLVCKNAIFDKQGNVMKRPGLIKQASINGQVVPIYGLYYWTAVNKLISVVSGRVYAISDMTSSDTNISGTAFLPQQSVEFADTGYWLYMCAGSGRLVKWNGQTSQVEFELDSVAPVNVSSVEAINTRIVCSEAGKNRLWYTKPADTTNPYNALEFDGYIEVSKIGEPIVDIKRLGAELIVLKEKSLSVLYDDGVTPFKSIIGSEHNIGLAARNSSIIVGDALYFLSDEGRISRFKDRTLQPISERWFQRELDKLSYIDDCIAFRQHNHIIFSFPTEKKSFALDITNKKFSEFTMLENGQDRPYIGYSGAELPTDGRTKNWIIGGKDGIRYYSDFSMYDDAGNPFRFMIRTSHLDWNTNRRKKVTRLIVKISTSSYGGVDPFANVDPNLPDGIRCEAYSYTFDFGPGITVSSVSGLPSGLTFSQATQTISGAVSDFVGDSVVTIVVKDRRGASKSFNTTLTIYDFTLNVGVS